MTTQAQREKVLSYLAIARNEGAECVLCGWTPKKEALAAG